MRVIAGTLKGRRLASPAWAGLRPTSDRLRETLFNLLGERVRGARVLDGYAGTGGLGIEAISRGAADVVFVEADVRAAKLIARNLDHCGVTGGYGIIRGTLPAAVDRPRSLGMFDLILIDPPYDATGLDRVLSALGRHLAETGLLVRERSKRTDVVSATGLEHLRTVLSGDSALDLYRAAGPPGRETRGS